MGKKAREEQIEIVRSVVGPDFREMDIIRALHLANDDPTAAINIIFDTLHLPPVSSTPTRPPPSSSPTIPPPLPSTPSTPPPPLPSTPSTPPPPPSSSSTSPPLPRSSTSLPANTLPEVKDKIKKENGNDKDWWLIGSADISGLSTCKGSRIQAGDAVSFSFPTAAPLKSPAFRGKGGSGSEIVRFSTSQHGEIGRIPNEWARCLLPLVRDGKVMLQGFCKSAPQVLSIMDSITLTIRFHCLSHCSEFKLLYFNKGSGCRISIVPY